MKQTALVKQLRKENEELKLDIEEFRTYANGLATENTELRDKVTELKAVTDGCAAELERLYAQACEKYGTPIKTKEGKARATNGFMAEVSDLLPLMATLDCLPEPWVTVP